MYSIKSTAASLLDQIAQQIKKATGYQVIIRCPHNHNWHTYIHIPPCIGAGKCASMQLEEGLSIYTAYYCYSMPVVFERLPDAGENNFIFYINVSNTVSEHEITCSDSSKVRVALGCNAYLSALFYASSTAGRFMPLLGTEYLSMIIIVSRKWLIDHIIDDKNGDTSPSLFKHFIVKGCAFYRTSLTEKEVVSITEIVKKEQSGNLQHMICHGQILLLVQTLISRIIRSQDGARESSAFLELERIAKIKEILVNSLDDKAFNVKELAKIAAMGTTKFKLLFKKVYGCSYYQYYKARRMELAKSLLDSRSLSVSEVAYQVGYTSISCFSRNFFEAYNILPSEYIKLSMKDLDEGSGEEKIE